MSIKYEIHGIKNAKGEGKEQKYVHLFAHEPQSDHALEDDIQASCSLTKADVRAAFSALRDHMARALASGSRFHFPGVGYFSLSVGLDAPDDLPSDKIWQKVTCKPCKGFDSKKRKRIQPYKPYLYAQVILGIPKMWDTVPQIDMEPLL